MTLLFDAASDLHVDFHGGSLDWAALANPGSRVLVIAGDISNDHERVVAEVGRAAAVYDHVLVTSGNHEHYNALARHHPDRPGASVQASTQALARALAAVPKVAFLHAVTEGVPPVWRQGSVAFAATTGWYDWRMSQDRGYDPGLCQRVWARFNHDAAIDFSPWGSPAALADAEADALADAVVALDADATIRAIVVVTHMAPRAECLVWRGVPAWDTMSASFGSTALARVAAASTKIRHWIYGHTHRPRRFIADGIDHLNNARGYPDEAPAGTPPWAPVQVAVTA